MEEAERLSDLILNASPVLKHAKLNIRGGIVRPPMEAAMSRDLCHGHITFTGSVLQVADFIEKWFHEGGADEFNLLSPIFPAGLSKILELQFI